MASKTIEKLANGAFTEDALSYRDRINGYYRTRGKVKLTEADMKKIEDVETAHGFLMEHRTDLATAKQKIKEHFGYEHREQVDRLIEDVRFLMGASFTVDKSYQRMIQHQDIEWWLQYAKDNKDGALAEKMLLRREKLYQLDQPDNVAEFNYFSVIVIKAEVKYFINDDDRQEAMKIRKAALKELNLIEDAGDVEYTAE